MTDSKFVCSGHAVEGGGPINGGNYGFLLPQSFKRHDQDPDLKYGSKGSQEEVRPPFLLGGVYVERGLEINGEIQENTRLFYFFIFSGQGNHYSYSFLGVFLGMYYGIAWWRDAKAGAIVGLVISITANLILLPLKNWIAGTASNLYGGRAAHWSLREQLEGDLNQAKYLKTQKKYDKALFVINNILKQDPDFPEAIYIKAKIMWEGFENAESARANLKKVMDLTSNKNDTIYRWSSHLYNEITSMQKRPKAQPSINEK